MSLIFIAMPTKGSVLDGAITPSVLSYIANLHFEYPEHTFIAPMIQDYQLLKFMPDVEATWQNWGQHCRTLIERSDQVWVLTLEGFDTSVGVKGEIEHARAYNVPVFFI